MSSIYNKPNNAVRINKIKVKQLECSHELFFWHIFLWTHGCNDEFWVVDKSVSVSVDFSENLVKLVFVEQLSEVLFVSVSNFFFWQPAVSVCIESLENLSEFFFLALRNQLRSNVGRSSDLQFLSGSEPS